ncbi:MAG TPA: septum formation initiator family protein [Gracilimonas sp.]|uniref:FtsB family cell division protein n=1 Tax=Gracilimonas sp. TaxID=1974203 RepID=UPI002DACC7E9|nr:septum formation initiator family protein [Gracilimonas sp.]
MNLQFLNPLRWKKSFLGLLLIAFLVVWFAFIDSYSLKTRWDLYSQKKELKERTKELNARSKELKTKIEQLDKDPALLEKIAREEYGMRKPGETVYKVKRQK